MWGWGWGADTIFFIGCRRIPHMNFQSSEFKCHSKSYCLSNSLGIISNECHLFLDFNGRYVQVEINLKFFAAFFLLRTDQRFVLWRVLMNRWLSIVLRTTAKGRPWPLRSSREICTNKRRHEWAQQGLEVRCIVIWRLLLIEMNSCFLSELSNSIPGFVKLCHFWSIKF